MAKKEQSTRMATACSLVDGIFGKLRPPVSVEINGESKNEKKNQNQSQNKNLSDNCAAVVAHRSVLRVQSNFLYQCPVSHGRGRFAGSSAGERILYREHR